MFLLCLNAAFGPIVPYRRHYMGPADSRRVKDETEELLADEDSEADAKRRGQRPTTPSGRLAVTPNEKLACRMTRLAMTAVLTACYLSVVFIHNSAELTAPVAHEIRGKFFEEPEEKLAQVVEQTWTQSLGPLMPGPDVADQLSMLQHLCKNQAMLEDAMVDQFECQLIRIDWAGGHSNHAHPLLPCDDASLKEMVEKGDGEPYDELPRLLKDIYATQNVPEDAQATAQYHIQAGWKLFKPFFTGEGDQKDGKWGPLPTIDRRLKQIGLAMQKLGNNKVVFPLNDWSPKEEMQQSADSDRAPNPDETLRSAVDANHHWDILFRCDPAMVKVVFKVFTRRPADFENVQSEVEDDGPHATLWWQFDFSWKRTGANLNFYRTRADVTTGVSFMRHTFGAILAPLIALALFTLAYLPYGVAFVVLLPATIYRLLSRTGNFEKLVSDLWDPFRDRSAYLPSFFGMLENLTAVIGLFAFVYSGVDIMSAEGTTAVHVGFEEMSSQAAYWKSLDLSNWDYFTQCVFGLWSLQGAHGAVLFFLFVRFLEFSLLMPGTSFLLTTFALAALPILHFCCIFLLIVMGYAALIFAMFGREYTQFCSFGQCFSSLVLYSFDFDDQSRAEDKVHPFMEKGAYTLQIMLLSFQVMVVTILLNMFTTIVIDAYSCAVETKRNPEKLREHEAYFITRLKILLGYDEALQREVDEGARKGFLTETAADEDDEGTHEALLRQLKQMQEALHDITPKVETLAETEARMRMAYRHTVERGTTVLLPPDQTRAER